MVGGGGERERGKNGQFEKFAMWRYVNYGTYRKIKNNIQTDIKIYVYLPRCCIIVFIIIAVIIIFLLLGARYYYNIMFTTMENTYTLLGNSSY